MKRFLLYTLFAVMLVSPNSTAADKKNKKFDKKQVVVEQAVEEEIKEQIVSIINPAKQLYGEWTIETVRKKTLETTDRAYIYLDFNNHRFYGNNGCNTINGSFTQSGNNISFKDVITTTESCKNNNDRGLLKTMAEVQRLQITSTNNIERMYLQNSKGNVLITLKRQNLDVFNGAWVVKELEGENTTSKDIKIVFDVNMLTVHANTGCNIVNGVVNIDSSLNKNFAVQFEDLRSSGHKCENIGDETNMLLALEQTESYKVINDKEIELLDKHGKATMVISRIKLKK